ncbi:hypothetical protein Trydic_g20071 [Trypoxylus dichotomus]
MTPTEEIARSEEGGGHRTRPRVPIHLPLQFALEKSVAGRECDHQRKFSVNFGRIHLPNHVDANDFLASKEVTDTMPLNIRQNIIDMHDGDFDRFAPNVREGLDGYFSSRPD